MSTLYYIAGDKINITTLQAAHAQREIEIDMQEEDATSHNFPVGIDNSWVWVSLDEDENINAVTLYAGNNIEPFEDWLNNNGAFIEEPEDGTEFDSDYGVS